MTNKCDDPYQVGCNDYASLHRDRIWSDKPDYPQDLCVKCFNALVESGEIDPSEWNLKTLLDDEYNQPRKGMASFTSNW